VNNFQLFNQSNHVKGGEIMKLKVRKVEEVAPAGFNGWG